MTDRDEDADPLLVRPYLADEPGGTAPHASAQTWPEAAAPAEPAPRGPRHAAGAVAAPAGPRREPRRRRPLVLLALALVLSVAGAAGLLWALLPEPGARSALPLDIPLPSVAGSGSVPATAVPPPAAAAPATTATSRTPATSSPTATPAPTSATTRPSPPTTRATTSPPTDRLAPPPADRVGRIHGNGEVCLDLNGAIAVDENHIQVYTCNDTAAQVWTLAADGTLRVVGKCAAAADDGTVRITGCDGRPSAQWRTGPDSTLVNLAGEDCLTDPGAGSRSGAGVLIEDCSGAERQRWELP